jgi:hypothetical protein
VADRDIVPGNLPQQGALRPYITILNLRAGIPTVRGLEAIRIKGVRFVPDRELIVLIDGVQQKLATQPVWDKAGAFTLVIPQRLAIGGHTVVVRQKGAEGQLEDAASFVKVVTDAE